MWGSSATNPTDLLNADDYSDPFDFGEKIPTVVSIFAGNL